MKELLYHRLLLATVERVPDRPCVIDAASGASRSFAEHLDRVGLG